MPRAGAYVLASLISGVSAALILASGPSYTETRSSQSSAYDVKQGQSTYNGCQASPCQIAYLNSVEDFCLWAPSQPVLSATRNNTEHTLVAWCMKNVHGTRLIPDGTISGVRLVITPEYVQISGAGDLANINVPADGVASASGEEDRAHGLVFTRAYGQLEQIYDWTSFVSQERFCFRACKPSATASATCTRIHDIFGCSENIPGNYGTGVFEDCIGDALEVPSILYQEVLAAPTHYALRPPSGHTTCGTIGDAHVAHAKRVPSHRHRTALTPSIAPTTTDTATTTSTSAASTSSSPPVSSATIPYSSSYPHIRSHLHSHTQRRSRHPSSTLPASVSSSSSHHSFSYSRPSSSTASSLSDPSSTSPTSSTPTFTPAFSTRSSLDHSSRTSTTSTPTPTSTAPTYTSSSPSSSDGTSSLETSSSSTATPTSPPTSPSTSSQSSDLPTFTTSRSPSSVPTTSTTTSSATFQVTQTQLVSQCPPPSSSAGSVLHPQTPLLSLMFTILMIVISSSAGALVL